MKKAAPVTFQSVILALEKFWADHGCLIWQPYYQQVGAGTMNPATFLRVLGPEPWNVAYVEPSIRPDDGRYGENPNRFQQHYQYQVILKPDPGNPQELYLQSLEAIGLNPREHDIRFVEDNWESPALGAWGLGWEVWLDGQEITQFTYFQQAGGLPCDPVSVELTYGLERILIALLNAPAIWDAPWSEHPVHGAVTYGDVLRKSEWEHSKYYFEIADVDKLRQIFSIYEAEAKSALTAGLVLPAYDYVLKCSHTFNVLDTRGAIGVTERQASFGRMRGLARKVAEAYIEQRQQLEYPLLKTDDGRRTTDESFMERYLSSTMSGLPSAPTTLLLEIGTEELPAADLDSAMAQLKELAPKMLAEVRLDHGEIKVLGTPRRFALLVGNLAPRQPDRETVVKGPPAARAFNAAGDPTPAAEGFARSKGVPVAALERRSLDGGEYVVAVVKETGKGVHIVLIELLPKLIAAIKFDKSMRWRAGDPTLFSRPIRWIVALLGESVIPFEYAGVWSGNASRGLRPFGSPEITIAHADNYLSIMAKAKIEVDPEKRRAAIRKQVRKLAREAGGRLADEGVLAEVTNLVERPTALRGSFDEAHLALPRDVLIAVMKKHQRYFPVMAATADGGRQTTVDDRLLPYFIAVRNGDSRHLDLVREGNEHVIRARFADADFFVREDVKHKLEDFRSRLATLTFQKQLGSMLDKAERVEKLTSDIARRLGLEEAETRTALRAAHLCKADLMTKMVVEMTALQGIIGREYALRSGETPEVALAIREHYLPSSAGDALPESKAGSAVGLADRLDSLAGLFAAGLAPTGSADPFGLRRAALAVTQILSEKGIDFDLRAALEAALALQPATVQPIASSLITDLLAFLAGRLRGQLLDAGYHYDVVDAVLAEQGHNPHKAIQFVKQLSAWVKRSDWPPTLAAYSRCVRITRDQKETYPVSADKFVEPSEKALYSAYQSSSVQSVSSVDQFFTALLPMIPAISKFFDDVLVMAEDQSLRENRLGLLQRIAGMAKGVADFSKLEGF
jgi:glycyl-tRNA synthetase